jgi:hypothetical protein
MCSTVVDFCSAVSVFVSWFVQAINDADTRKHNNSFFIFYILNCFPTYKAFQIRPFF